MIPILCWWLDIIHAGKFNIKLGRVSTGIAVFFPSAPIWAIWDIVFFLRVATKVLGWRVRHFAQFRLEKSKYMDLAYKRYIYTLSHVYPGKVWFKILVNLRNRTGEERRRQTLCDKHDNNFAWKNLPPNFTFPKTDLFVEEHKMSMLREFPTKHASKSPVTFVTLKRFAVLFFLPSGWVNSPVPPLPDLPAESLSTAPYIAIGRGQRCQMSLGRCCTGSVLLLVQVLLSLVWNSLFHKQRKIRPRPH